jgi:hypothetical protein
MAKKDYVQLFVFIHKSFCTAILDSLRLELYKTLLTNLRATKLAKPYPS